jgi:hypothetical protein
MIEQRLLADQQCFNELLRVEEELTDDYVQEKLSWREKASFENYFVNHPQRHEDIAFAKAFNKYVQKHPPDAPASAPPISRWRLALGTAMFCACFLLGAVSLLLYREVADFKKRIAQIESQWSASAERERALRARSDQLAKQAAAQEDQLAKLQAQLAPKPNPKAGLAAPTTVSLLLAPGRSRAAAGNATAVFLPYSRRLRLVLEAGEARYPNYRAQVQTVEGEVVHDATIRGGPQKNVIVLLPASLMTRSDYLVMLNGITTSGNSERVGTYYFTVVRK